MTDVTLYGPHWSAYTRTARLALLEKPVDYELVEVDFSTGQMPAEHLTRHPFAKVPVLDHRGYVLYETAAICRYIDAAFAGTALQPENPRAVGRMAQIIAVIDAYLSHEIRMGYVNEAIIKPMLGMVCDQDRVASACRAIAAGLAALVGCVDEPGEYLVGDRLSLADLHAAPLFDFLDTAPQGGALIDAQPTLRAWWTALSERPSISATSIDLAVFARAG